MGKSLCNSNGPAAQNGGGQGNSGPFSVRHDEQCPCIWCLQGHR